MLSFLGSVLCIIVGLAFIGRAFYIQKQEDRIRIPGFYTEASIVRNVLKKTSSGEKRDVTFEFTKDFKVWHCTNSYDAQEAESWRVGRRFLIVYDEALDKVYCNPMKASRKKQAISMAIGGVIILVGIQWSIVAAGLLI